MIDLKNDNELYLTHFERFEKPSSAIGPSWLLPIRKAAISRFMELGFPTTRDEEWRYTNVAPIANTAFERPDSDTTCVKRSQIEPFVLADSASSLLVFVNGHYAAHLSTVRNGAAGVRIGNLAAVIASEDGLVTQHLTRYASYKVQPFTALNTALLEDGAFVFIPKGAVVEEPIQLLFVSTAPRPAVVSHPRNLIVADTSSQVTIVETYAGIGTGVYFTNAVTEIVVGDNAVVDHYKIERETDEAFHIATLQLHQRRSSMLYSHIVSLGGALVRHDVNSVLDGEGCECTLNGLYMVNGNQHVDNHLRVDHVKPHCHSREFYKGVLDGHGKGVFSGRIMVHKGAQKTDAKQTNKSLLLSEDAQVESKPQLEIFADDVKCTHGATIGQVSEDAIFYLRSRGLSEQAARSLLVYAFARESVDQIRLGPLRAQIGELLFARLPHGQLLGEAV